MKRKIFLLTLVLLLVSAPVFAGVITYTLYPVPYPVLVDGSRINSNLPILTYRANGGDNTYVPLRAVLDMMGAKTAWNGEKVNITVGPDPAKVADSVVQIYVVKNGRDVSRASGVIIDYDEILTCYHVADSGDSYRVIYNDGSTTTATLENAAPSEDAAILEPARKDRKPVKIGDSEEIKFWDKVFVISSPRGKLSTILSGNVLKNKITATNNLEGFVTTIITEPGSSGGGAFNVNGELIGIIGAGDGNSSFAIPINDIRKELVN